MSSCDIVSLSNSLMSALTEDIDIELPNVDISGDEFKIPGDLTSGVFQEPSRIDPSSVTTKQVDGEGAFDVFMSGIAAHLRHEYEAGRISGDEYTRAFIALSETAMNNAIEFTLQKDNNYWNAHILQAQAITARVLLETERLKMFSAKVEALHAKSNYAISKAELSIKSVEHCSGQYKLDNTLPLEVAVLSKQAAGIELDNVGKGINNTNILPAQEKLLLEQYEVQRAQTADSRSDRTPIVGILGKEKELKSLQGSLLREQVEVQRAQTSDLRTDSAPVTGILGKQKDLYTQQIEAYKRNAEINAVKIVSDAWVAQKTLDEGLGAPSVFTNDSVNATVLNALGKAGLQNG